MFFDSIYLLGYEEDAVCRSKGRAARSGVQARCAPTKEQNGGDKGLDRDQGAGD